MNRLEDLFFSIVDKHVEDKDLNKYYKLLFKSHKEEALIVIAASAIEEYRKKEEYISQN